MRHYYFESNLNLTLVNKINIAYYFGWLVLIYDTTIRKQRALFKKKYLKCLTLLCCYV